MSLSNIFELFNTEDKGPSVYGIQLESSGKEMPGGRRVTQVPKETLKRVPKEHLQLIYYRDDITFRGVNVKTDLLMSTPFYWKCGSTEDADYMKMWTEKSNMMLSLRETLKNTLLYGVGWLELLWNGGHEEDRTLVRLDAVDSKTMDFIRDTRGKIAYNDEGFPVGYMQKVPIGYEIPVNREVEGTYNVMDGPVQRIFDDEIAYFVFDSLGGSADGVGIVEPQYDIVRRKKSIEKGHAQSVLRRGNTRYHVKIGDEKYRASPTERKNIKEELENLKPQDDIVTEWFTDIEVLEAQDVGDISGILKYYVARQASCMGIPMPFVSEEGESTNRATLGDQKQLLFLSIDAMRKQVIEQFQRQVVPYIMENREFTEPPRLCWEPISLEGRESKSLRLQRYAKAGLIEPDKKLQTRIMEWEGLDGDKR